MYYIRFQHCIANLNNYGNIFRNYFIGLLQIIYSIQLSQPVLKSFFLSNK